MCIRDSCTTGQQRDHQHLEKAGLASNFRQRTPREDINDARNQVPEAEYVECQQLTSCTSFCLVGGSDSSIVAANGDCIASTSSTDGLPVTCDDTFAVSDMLHTNPEV